MVTTVTSDGDLVQTEVKDRMGDEHVDRSINGVLDRDQHQNLTAAEII